MVRNEKRSGFTGYKNLGEKNGQKSLPELCREPGSCCGCSACYAVCPVHAITMEPDSEGFLYPVVDADKCICCHKCIRVCAFKKDQERKGF